MNEKGFYILFDLVLSAIALIAFLSLVQANPTDGYSDLVLSQKSHDLLTVWAKERNFDLKEMKTDFELVFSGKSGAIEVGGKKILIGKNKDAKKAFVEETVFLDDALNESRIRLVVFD